MIKELDPLSLCVKNHQGAQSRKSVLYNHQGTQPLSLCVNNCQGTQPRKSAYK